MSWINWLLLTCEWHLRRRMWLHSRIWLYCRHILRTQMWRPINRIFSRYVFQEIIFSPRPNWRFVTAAFRIFVRHGAQFLNNYHKKHSKSIHLMHLTEQCASLNEKCQSYVIVCVRACRVTPLFCHICVKYAHT